MALFVWGYQSTVAALVFAGFCFLYSRTPIVICCFWFASKGSLFQSGWVKSNVATATATATANRRRSPKTGMFSDQTECSYPSTFIVKTGAGGF